MGYYQNKYANWLDSDPSDRVCEYCGKVLHPLSPNQKRHSYDSDDMDAIACAWDYELENMGSRAYLKHCWHDKKRIYYKVWTRAVRYYSAKKMLCPGRD